MHRNLHGSIVPFVALILVTLLALGALAIDISNSYSAQTKVKNALDLAALAGISQLNGPQTVSLARSTALQYINDNLSMNLPSFETLVIPNNNLSIQLGVYDFTNMTFTWDELNTNVNSIMISFNYNVMTFLATVLSRENVLVGDNTIAAKQPAGELAPGGGFPLVIDSAALSQARANNNMVNLEQTGNNSNSYFTSFSNQNANANDIRDILSYLTDPTSGTRPPGISVNNGFDVNVNNGQLGSVYMDLNSVSFEGMTFVAPVGSLTNNNEARVDAFVGVTINDVYQDMGDWYIDITILPGYIDNTWSGFTIGSGIQNINNNDTSLVANSFGLVQ